MRYGRRCDALTTRWRRRGWAWGGLRPSRMQLAGMPGSVRSARSLDRVGKSRVPVGPCSQRPVAHARRRAPERMTCACPHAGGAGGRAARDSRSRNLPVRLPRQAIPHRSGTMREPGSTPCGIGGRPDRVVRRPCPYSGYRPAVACGFRRDRSDRDPSPCSTPPRSRARTRAARRGRRRLRPGPGAARSNRRRDRPRWPSISAPR